MIRRGVDVLVAVAALIAFAPLLVVVAIAVRLDSPGPALYGGARIGLDGRRFRMWKFRTMVIDADRKGPSITSRSDPRITRLGGFLRRSKIDELPQLVNLLLGDLTLVGPRPEAPDLVERYSPEQKRILAVKPGITGPGTLAYTQSDAEVIPAGVAADDYYMHHLLEPKLKLDLAYVEQRTAWSDTVLVFKTAGYSVRALLRVLR